MKVSEIILGSLAVIGTLLGVFIGHHTAMRSVQLQLEHQDRTRYQEQRLITYSSFLDDATNLVAMGESKRPLNARRIEAFENFITGFNKAYRRLQIAGGHEVREIAGEVHALVLPFARGEYKTTDDLAAAQRAYMNKVRDLLQAMRTELGTEVSSRQSVSP